MKAKLSYASGWRLKFPCHTNASRLFLEWLGEYQIRSKRRVTFSINREVPDDSEIDSDLFVIRFENLLRPEMIELTDYINNNS